MKARSPLLALIWCLGCGSELVTSARQDDLTTFRRQLVSTRDHGQLDGDELGDVARAVATRELLTSYGDSAVARVDELAACASELSGPLRDISERSDDGAASATQVLIDSGKWFGSLDSLVERYSNDPRPAWRAVAARAAIDLSHQAVRTRGYLDGDLRVRRAALRAARTAANPKEADALLEAARLDPDPVSRRFALEALSAIAEPRSLQRLRDLWPGADEQGRRTMTHAWGRRVAYANGGEAQLTWVLSTQTGLAQLSAAVILLQNQARASQQALAVLVRAIEDGAPDEQRYAAQYAPLSAPSVVSALVDAAHGDDEVVAAVAASALLRVSTTRRTARERLRALMQSDNPAAARQARFALAAVRDVSAVEPLVRELATDDPELRAETGRLLLRLDKVDAASTLLADPAAQVRTRFACAVMLRDRAKGELFSR